MKRTVDGGITIANGDKFEFGGERFQIDTTAGGNRRPSDSDAFTLVKTKSFLDLYERLAHEIAPRGILELGIFQGGSFVLLDKMFRPERIAAVDIASKPVQPLIDYAERHRGRHVYFSTSQDDEIRLSDIVEKDLNGQLDLVVDDASHHYERSKRSFEILFPKLSPGGVYVIEDWAWSHMALYQGPDGIWHGQPALTNLLFEIIASIGSDSQIASIEIHKPLAIVRKGRQVAKDASVWQNLRLREKTLPRI